MSNSDETLNAPIGLLDQWNVVLAGCKDHRLSSGDKAVLAVIVDRYMKRHGIARASYTHLAREAGFSRRQSAIDSVRRLAGLGYLKVERLGRGTRPTEYAPNWQMGASGAVEQTTTSGALQRTSEVRSTAPLEALVVRPTDPHNPPYVPADKPADVKEGIQLTHAAAPAPALPGGPGASRDPEASRPFDELWEAYGRKRDRSKAKGAFEKINPDPEHFAAILAGAQAWRAAYDEQERPAKFRKALHNWLAGECWLEDEPEPYEDPKAAATSRKRADRAPAHDLDEPEPEPEPASHGEAPEMLEARWLAECESEPGRHLVTVKAASTYDYDGGTDLSVSMRNELGQELYHQFAVQASNSGQQEAGQRILGEICYAAGLAEIEEAEELVGLTFVAVVSPTGRVRYEAAAANDNTPPADAEAA